MACAVEDAMFMLLVNAMRVSDASKDTFGFSGFLHHTFTSRVSVTRDTLLGTSFICALQPRFLTQYSQPAF